MAKRILIVDDVEINREILKLELCCEYEIVEATNGKEAIDYINKNYGQISAVLLDIVMPIMDGYEVLKIMRNDVNLAKIPVIVVTGSDDEDARLKALAFGATDLIIKPYNPEIIKHCLHNNITLYETVITINAIQNDNLTGLYNRDIFFQKIDSIMQTAAPNEYIIGSLDIDNFKLVNAQFGTNEGDRILKYIGKFLSNLSINIGGLYCQITGDNFAGFFPNKKEIIDYIDKERVNFLPKDIITNLSISIGRYIIADPTLSASALYDRAYLAKQSIKGRYDTHVAFFDDSMLREIVEKQEIIAEMNQAIKDENFEVWFQPQYNHNNGNLIGAEALVRWRHPVKGLIAPYRFIPIFEKNGFIYELDKCVWEKTCQYLNKWITEGLDPLPVSVNISRYDLFKDDLLNILDNLLVKYNIPIDLFRLEITESAFASSTNQVVNIVNRLIKKGYTVEIDDFGSGYSSLNTLKDVPAQILKLDMKFIEDNNDNGRGGNIVESVIRMAKWLNMVVIAEGVETIEQADFLKSIDCYYIQGYFYNRPMPASDYENISRTCIKDKNLIKLNTIDTLNSKSFWDPKSIDTLIFNSYVGSACVYEFHAGKIKLIRANDKFINMVGSAGLATENMFNLKWENYLNKKALDEIIMHLNQSIKINDEVQVEYSFIDLPDCPHEIFIQSTMRVIASLGDIYIVYCINENITALREAKLAEKRSSEQLSAIMNNINAGVTASIITKDDHRILFTNDYMCKMFGYTRNEFEKEVGNSFKIIYHDDLERILALTLENQKHKTSCSFEYRGVCRDFSIRLMRANVSFINIFGIEGVIQLSVTTDVTMERQLEIKRNETSEQMEVIMSNVNNGVSAVAYDENGTETIFINKRYYEIFGYTKEQYYEEVKQVYSLVHPDDQKKLLEKIVQLEYNHKPINLEIRIIKRDHEERILKVQMSIIHFSGYEKPIQLCVFTDITEEKETNEQVKFFNDIAHDMLGETDSTKAIETTLNRLLNLFKGTRIYIFKLLNTKGMISNTYQVCSKKVVSNKDRLQNLPCDNWKNFINILAKDDYINIENIDKLSDDFGEKQILKKANISNLLVVNIKRDNKIIGYMAIENALIKKTYINNIIAISNYLSIMFRRRDSVNKIKVDNENLMRLINDIPGGFVKLKVMSDKHFIPVYANKGFEKLVGIPYNNLKKQYRDDNYWGIYPDDCKILVKAFNEIIDKGEGTNEKYRILNGKNEYIWVMFFGRKTINENGEIFINMYYIDINKQVKFEEILPIVLSAVVASSANLVFIKDSDYRYVSCNKKFANAIGYDKISDVIGKTDFDLVPEKEASEYRAQEKHIEETKESQVIYTKIPQTKDDKIRYAETSKFPLLDGDNKVIGFYGVVRDIDSSNNKDLQLKNINSCIPGGFVTSTYEKETNGEPQLIINYFNNDFGKMLGYNNDEHEIIKPREAFPFIYEEDLPMIKMKLQQLVEFNIPIEGTLRMYHKNGSIIWVTHKAEAVARFDDKVIINAVFLNTTDQQLYIGRLRMSEEENRLAIKHSKSTMGRFSIKEKTLVIPEDIAKQIGIQATMYNVPDELIRKGLIAKDSEKKYLALFEDIFNGKPNGEAVYQYLSPDGWRWFESNYSTIYNENNQPTNAIITFLDVTEQLEKEVIYKKWNQSLNNKDPKKYTLFRGNLNKNIMYEIAEGTLLSFVLNDNFSYTDNKNEFINKCVYKEDAELFNDFVEIKFLLANYYQGKRNFRLEFRGVFDNVIRWLLLTIELIEYPNSNDIEAYLLFEDIDEMKKAEIERNTLMEIDPLTGLLNRKTFKDKVNMLIANSENIKAKEKNCFALFMLDIDGFKMVNDSFGHAVGDETLIDFAKIIRKLFRKEDYVCRFGGDEYMMCINNISDRSVIIQKVKQLCALTRKSFSLEVKISSSIGISLYPFDGNDFETLYHKADLALYHVKATAKSNYAFYNEDMIDESPKVKLQISQTSNLPGEEKKRRMLIVDNNEFSRKMLEEMFKDEFIIETVEDAEVALIRLHRYGIGISVVLLNLIMPNMNGFYFLKKMRESVETSMIPVIVISELDDRETSQKAIKYGTVDYITKPIDVDLLKIRVASAIAKSENEYLKVQNRYLTVEHEEVTNYKTIIENDGIIVIKYEKSSEKFQYDHNINSYLVGNYDNRSLWEILIKDKVASLLTVLKLQKFIDDFIHNDTLISDQIKVRLTSVSKIKELYIVKVIKRLDEAYYGDKLIITIMKENK